MTEEVTAMGAIYKDGHGGQEGVLKDRVSRIQQLASVLDTIADRAEGTVNRIFGEVPAQNVRCDQKPVSGVLDDMDVSLIYLESRIERLSAYVDQLRQL